jgi:hypothetical protein
MRRILVVAALTAGLTVVAVSPAQAAYSDCPNNRVCLFDSNNGGTLIWAGYVSPGICHNLPSDVNNRANSFVNKLDGIERAVQFYDNSNCQPIALRRQQNSSIGPHFTGAQDNFYQDMLLSHRNRATSIWFNTCNPPGCGSGLT